MFLGLRTAQYHVETSELPRARQWYAKALGIEPYFEETYYVGFNVGGFELGLVPDDGISMSKKGTVAVYWGVANIQLAFEHLLAIGAEREAEIQHVGEGIKKATVLDPFGNPLGIIENPHFSN